MQKIPHVIAVLPTDEINGGCDRILSICRLLILSANSAATASNYLADAKNIGKCAILWDVPEKPDKKKHPTIAKAVKKSPFKLKKLKGCRFVNEPEKFVHTVSNLHKISILKKNPIDGIPKIFLVLFPLFLLIAFMLPFAKITKVTATISNERNRIQERNSLTVAPSFEFTFDGKESLQRIARYAIGRFNAIITTDKMVQQYVETTLEENNYPTYSWRTDNFNIPPEGTTIKFSRPDNLGQEAADSIGAAWKYWTSIVTDSIAYLTEFYYKEATAQHRLHHGIDLASARKRCHPLHALRPAALLGRARSYARRPHRDHWRYGTHYRASRPHRYRPYFEERRQDHRRS